MSDVTTSIVIGHAEPALAEAWARHRAELWPDEPAEALRKEVDDFFAGRTRHLGAVLFARDPGDDGALLGFVELNLRPYAEGCDSSPVGFLEAWYVSATARRRGVGAALVRAAEDWARGCGCREFASDTLADNQASTAVHLALGFEEVEVIRCFRKSLD